MKQVEGEREFSRGQHSLHGERATEVTEVHGAVLAIRQVESAENSLSRSMVHHALCNDE